MHIMHEGGDGMSMTTYTQWWIAHPWHVSKGAVVPPDCDCEYCQERRDMKEMKE